MSDILSDNAEVDADIPIRMAIPNTYPLFASLFQCSICDGIISLKEKDTDIEIKVLSIL